MSLTFRTAATVIEQAIFNALNLALRRRLPPVADIPTLRATATRGASSGYARSDFELVYVAAAAVCYQWSTTSTAADDGSNVIKPNDALASNGRWLKTSSTVQTGYVVAVRLYEGEQSEDEILDRLLGQRPAILVRWQSAKHGPKSQVPGSLYRYETDFEIWVVSSNMRGGEQPAAVVGSPLASEAAVDPGANAMLGDVKSTLAGLTGETIGESGIAYCEIGKEEPIYRSLAERRFVFALGVRVHASVSNPDTDLVALTEIDAQLERADLQGSGLTSLDPTSCITSGLTVAEGQALGAVAIAAGSALIGNVAVNYAGGTVTLSANSWTYRDLAPNGTLTLTSVGPFPVNPPPVASGSLRIGVTYTDGSSVAGDELLAPTLIANPPSDPQIIPTT